MATMKMPCAVGSGGGTLNYAKTTFTGSGSDSVTVLGKVVFSFLIGNYNGNMLRNWGSENEYFYQYNNNTVEEHTSMGAFTQIDDTHASFSTGSSSSSSNTVYYWYE